MDPGRIATEAAVATGRLPGSVLNLKLVIRSGLELLTTTLNCLDAGIPVLITVVLGGILEHDGVTGTTGASHTHLHSEFTAVDAKKSAKNRRYLFMESTHYSLYTALSIVGLFL